MYTPHPRGKPDRVDVGIFMFFAWPVLLVIGLVQLFFTVIGWLFEQAWFYVLLIVFLVIVGATFCVAS